MHAEGNLRSAGIQRALIRGTVPTDKRLLKVQDTSVRVRVLPNGITL